MVKETETILCFSWDLSGIKWPIYERLKSKLKLDVQAFHNYPPTKLEYVKLAICGSPTGDAAGVSPEIGITYIAAMQKTVIMDFDESQRL